jgi:hypothetical protein
MARTANSQIFAAAVHEAISQELSGHFPTGISMEPPLTYSLRRGASASGNASEIGHEPAGQQLLFEQPDSVPRAVPQALIALRCTEF